MIDIIDRLKALHRDYEFYGEYFETRRQLVADAIDEIKTLRAKKCEACKDIEE